MTTKVSTAMNAAVVDVTGLIPVGGMIPYTGATEPDAGAVFKFPNGQAISRTTYAVLFALYNAAGLPYGVGDGTTTFNVPDLRGRVTVGKDNMGGTPANRVTNAISGLTGTTLGAAGGDQRLQQHNHTTTVNDPGHTHSVQARQNDSPSSGIADGAGTITVAVSTSSSTTGISVDVADTGAGASQNMQPSLVTNFLLRVK